MESERGAGLPKLVTLHFYHTLLTLLAIPSDVGDEVERSRWSRVGREVGGKGDTSYPSGGLNDCRFVWNRPTLEE